MGNIPSQFLFHFFKNWLIFTDHHSLFAFPATIPHIFPIHFLFQLSSLEFPSGFYLLFSWNCYFLYVVYSIHHYKFNFCLSFPSLKKFPESSILFHLAKHMFYNTCSTVHFSTVCWFFCKIINLSKLAGRKFNVGGRNYTRYTKNWLWIYSKFATLPVKMLPKSMPVRKSNLLIPELLFNSQVHINAPQAFLGLFTKSRNV